MYFYIYHTWNLAVLYFQDSTLQKKARISITTRGPIWVPGMYIDKKIYIYICIHIYIYMNNIYICICINMYIYIYKSEIVYLYIPVSTHLNMTHFSHPKNASTLKGKQETVGICRNLSRQCWPHNDYTNNSCTLPILSLYGIFTLKCLLTFIS